MDRLGAHVAAWLVAGVAVLLLLLSLTSPVGGYTGMHMGWMWLFGLVPVAALLILGLELAGHNRGTRPPREGPDRHA